MSLNFEDWRDAMSLISRYARSADASDLPGVLECFTDDVIISIEAGKLVVSGRAEVSDFYSKVYTTRWGPGIHLISNYGFESAGPSIVVHCSAIVCLCRKEGFVTTKGIVYIITCVRDGSDLRIRKLQHSSTWECNAPGGLPTMSWLSHSGSSSSSQHI